MGEDKVLRRKFSDSFLALGLVFLGLLTRLLFLWQPAQVVFDEVHFGKFVNSYFSGRYYFDIHPPLGKLIISLGAWLGNYPQYIARFGLFSFENIGQSFGEVPYLWFRFLPALAGALIPVIVFWFLKELGLNPVLAFFTGLFLVFDNALLVQSRLILLDSFLILFGFAGLALFFRSRNNSYSWPELLGSGALFGLSTAVKWTGLSFWGVASVIYFLESLRRERWLNQSKSPLPARPGLINRLVIGLGALVILPLIVYFLIFQIHFSFLPQCPLPGEGNGCDFMSQEFREQKLNPLEKFFELNQKMWQYNTGLSASHDFGSKAIGWPLMIRAVYYWVESRPGLGAARIYFVGNPLVWFLGLVGIINLFFFSTDSAEERLIKQFLLFLYLANFLPFLLVKRVLFLYHYLSALIVSVASFWLVMSKLVRQPVWIALVLAAVIGSWLFYAPLSYGFVLTEQQFQSRQWFSLWFSTNPGLKQLCQQDNCLILNWLIY